jgi:SAM-dependent methyltransferase
LTIFGDYARYYDELYRDKDYAAECQFLEEVFARYAAQPVDSILDLGCGTGGHARVLAGRGYRVTGVDQSAAMLAVARGKGPAAIDYRHGDLRQLALNQTFSAAISMFAVLGYLTTNDELLAALTRVRQHLVPGGLFVFDCWFGPAVLAQRPADRYRIVATEAGRVIRFVHPELDLVNNVVAVHYQVLHLQGARVAFEGDEVHRMRYLFPPEVTNLLHQAGFRALRTGPFMRLADELTEQDWNMAVVAVAV